MTRTERSALSVRHTYLDGLRALAVLLVFGLHLFPGKLPGGWIGVTIFFGLSGYLITGLLVREHKSTGRVALRFFYMRRALRLMPALAVAVALLVPFGLLIGFGAPVTSGLAAITYTMDVFMPITGVNNLLTQTWSLAVEEQFYILWPAVLVVGLRYWPTRITTTALALGILCAAAGAVVAAAASTHAAYYSPFSHLSVMLLGVYLAAAEQQGQGWVRRLSSKWIPGLALTVTTAVAFTTDQYQPWLYNGGMVIIGVPFVMLIGHLMAKPRDAVARLLSRRPLVWLGERSYGFYLWHFPVTWVVQDARIGLLGMPLALGISLVLTQASWTFVEKPFLSLKPRFSPTANTHHAPRK